jgi:hypothetical protein
LIGPPDEAAAEECHKQTDSIVELDFGASEIQLVAEPVDVQEGGGEFVEDEDRAVVVEERALVVVVISIISFFCPQIQKRY